MLNNDSDSNEAVSMETIIKNHLENDEKKLYRVRYESTGHLDSQRDASITSNRSLLAQNIKDNGFFHISIKRQEWFGMPAIAIFINNVTKKIISDINDKNA